MRLVDLGTILVWQAVLLLRVSALLGGLSYGLAYET